MSASPFVNLRSAPSTFGTPAHGCPVLIIIYAFEDQAAIVVICRSHCTKLPPVLLPGHPMGCTRGLVCI